MAYKIIYVFFIKDNIDLFVKWYIDLLSMFYVIHIILYNTIMSDLEEENAVTRRHFRFHDNIKIVGVKKKIWYEGSLNINNSEYNDL